MKISEFNQKRNNLWEEKFLPKKRIGVVIRGITTGNTQRQRKDWTVTRDNVKEYLIDPIGEPGVVYITTYGNNDLKEVQEFYNPKKLNALNFEGSNQLDTMIKALINIEQEELDFIVVIRFDTEYLQKIDTFEFDFDKFNFLFKEKNTWAGEKFISDNFFAFPKKHLQSFIDALKVEQSNPSRGFNDLHNSYNRLKDIIGEESIHFVFDGEHFSDVNPYFKIKRI
jgi:hypothetical protein